MRILFVALSESIHTARWIDQIADEGSDIHLFSATDSGPHPTLRNVTVHSFYRQGSDVPVKQTGLRYPFRRGADRFKKVLEHVAPSWSSSPARLARVIQTVKPHVIHVLEMQRAGYLMLEARQRLNGYALPPCIYSSWGSDIFLFGRMQAHRERVKAFLEICDYYIADCQRDVRLAKDFGFSGKLLGVFPVVGGYDIKHMSQYRQEPISSRRTIALKGYHGGEWGGRALVGLQALSMCAELLRGYEVVIYSANKETKQAADEITRDSGFTINILPQSPHDEMVKLLGRARIAVGISLTDGTPNAMLEAMVMGAFPIQSNTISTAEWIDDGRNGFLVPAEDPIAIGGAIKRALLDDTLVEKAAKINTRQISERIDRTVIQPQVIAIYNAVVNCQRSV